MAWTIPVMSPDLIFDNLLSATQTAYQNHGAAQVFSPFPDDVTRQKVTPYHRPCGDVLRAETALVTNKYQELQDAIIAAGPHAHWRETYKGTDIGDHFMDRFGCYSIVGTGGPFMSATLWAWMVYMPAHLYYPWHHHPGEEMYFVVSGSAVFKRDARGDEVLTEGDTVVHESNQSHAMETKSDPVLCLVFWRNGFETPPILTERR